MEIQIINHESKWLKAVQNLGDTASSTVGFLAREVYADYARKGHILVVTEGEQLLAYTMFRFKKSSIVIVHLCVDPKYRGRGIPSQMLDYLIDQNREYISHIQLACRRDYGLERFWQKLGFSAVAEKPGRALKDRTVLTIWVRENPNCANLFASLAGADTGKALVVLDTNIVIDLCDGNNNESNYLLQSYLGAYVEFRITKYVLNEINQSNDSSVRNKHRDYAKEHYPTLENVDDELFEQAKTALLEKRKVTENSNMWYDVIHIAQAIAAGAEAFVTRDGGWLNNDVSEYVEKQYGLRILSPGEFINAIDELNSPSDYAPYKLAGLGLEYSKMQSADFTATVSTFFQRYGCKKAEFEKQLRKWIGSPDQYTTLLIKTKTAPVCLITYGIPNEVMRVETLLLNTGKIKPSLRGTFVKYIAFKLLDDAHKGNAQGIQISKEGLDGDVCGALRDCGFFDDKDCLLRIIKAGIVCAKELQPVKTLPADSPLNLAIKRFGNDWCTGALSPEQVVSIEKAMWPMKLAETHVPCFIVPIKADYAVQLFDENLYNQEFSLFENDKSEPALSIENAYFKTARHSVSQAPARILWYVSSSNYIGTPAIRACSYLDHTEKGTAKELFEKYKRLGVLEWQDLQKLSLKGNVATYVFSYTELFENPVGLDEVRRLLAKPKETFQSFCTIDEELFLSIYQAGVQGENHARQKVYPNVN